MMNPVVADKPLLISGKAPDPRRGSLIYPRNPQISRAAKIIPANVIVVFRLWFIDFQSEMVGPPYGQPHHLIHYFKTSGSLRYSFEFAPVFILGSMNLISTGKLLCILPRRSCCSGW